MSLLCKLNAIFSGSEMREEYAMNMDDDYLAIIETLMASHIDFVFRADAVFHVVMRDRRICEASDIISLFYKLYKILLKIQARVSRDESHYITKDNILCRCGELKMVEICGNILSFICSVCLMENKFSADSNQPVDTVELVLDCDKIIEKCMMLMQMVSAQRSEYS
jgi:hypothetical protein